MDDVETRTVLTLRTGTKICVLIGLAFIVLAIYYFAVPITSVRTTTGAVFGCGTGMSPSHGSFADGVCGNIATENRYRAFAALAIGLVTIIAGGAMFGVDRREEQRRVPRGHRDTDARDRDWTDEPRSDRDRNDDARSDRDWADEDRRPSRERPSGSRSDESSSDGDDDHDDWDDDRSGRRSDDHRRYDDRDDRPSRRRETTDRRDDRDDDRFASRRGPDQR